MKKVKLLLVLVACVGCVEFQDQECTLVFHDSTVRREKHCSRKQNSAIVVCGDYLTGPTFDGVRELSCKVEK